ncbi:MFS transporter [Planomonospora algeriensis]
MTRRRVPEAGQPPRGRTRLPPPLLALIGGTFVSVAGDSVASLSLILDAAAHGEPWWVTEAFFAELLPPLALAPLLGLIVDRANAKHVWLTAVVLQAAAFTTAALVPVFHLRVGLIAVANVFAVASSSAAFKLLPRVAGGAELERANSGVSAAMSLAFLVGPGVGGAAYVVTGSGWLLAFNAATFAVIAAVVVIVVPGDAGERMELDTRSFAGARAGLRVLRTSPMIGPMLPVFAGAVFATSIEGVAGVFYLRDVAENDAVYGLLLAAWAMGSVPGSLIGGWHRLAGEDTGLVVGGALLISGALLVEGLVPVAWIIGLVFVLGGFGNGVHNVGVRTAIHRRVPEDFHGRAWAYYSVLTNSCVALGYIVGTPGLMAGSRDLIIASGALGLTMSLIGLWRLRRALRLTAGEPPLADTGPSRRDAASAPETAAPYDR